jgi:uncharacterized protein (UPF0276 family)
VISAEITTMQGQGVGLRAQHYPELVGALRNGSDAPAWLEVISENFFEPGGNARRVLHEVRAHLPIALHGVSLSIGSVDALDERYLRALCALIAELEPALVSDHLCWGSVNGYYAHDLLPMPYSEEALAHVAERVLCVQERLRRPIALENVSSYLTFRSSTMSEWEFLSELVRRTDCKLLLDVNNAFVSAHNHGFAAADLITGLPRGSVAQLHLAGHSARGELLLDTHDGPVCDDVWSLYRLALQTHGAVPTCIEWDDELPSYERLLAESARAAELACDV